MMGRDLAGSQVGVSVAGGVPGVFGLDVHVVLHNDSQYAYSRVFYRILVLFCVFTEQVTYVFVTLFPRFAFFFARKYSVERVRVGVVLSARC